MSHPARLSLRAPPHLPFVQGWPGIPGTPSRKGAAVHGTVEVRTGAQAIKAKWVRAEIRKYEAAPPNFPSSTETWEHVGEISTLWAAPAGKEWDDLQQADFKFYIPLPDNLPPSVELQKNTGVRYELVAALCYRQKGGVFKKESAPIMKISESIRITKHDIHSAWPVFNVPENRQVTSASGELALQLQRPTSAFGPGDRILFTATLRSARPKPFKLKGFECNLVETITLTPTAETSGKSKKGKGPVAPITRTRIVASARQIVDESIGRGGDKSARMDLAVPADKLLFTLANARTLGIRYDLEVKAVCDSGIPDLGIGKIMYTVGPYARSHAQQAVRDIGHVEALCPGVPNPAGPGLRPHGPLSNPSSRPTSFGTNSFGPGTPASIGTPPFPGQTPSPQPPFPPNGFFAQGNPRSGNQPIQGFVPRQDFRRRSSGTSTITTTTTTTTFDQSAAHGHGRPQSMQLRTGNVAFPSASPAPVLQRSTTGRTVDSGYTAPSSPIESLDDRARFAKSDLGHGDFEKRFSSGTTATFGRWDRDLRMAITPGEQSNPITPTGSKPPSINPGYSPIPGPSIGSSRLPPSAWQSAEQEKTRLYDEARTRAAVAQQSNGASLHTIGLDEPSVPPPEYAPPRPAALMEQYPSAEKEAVPSQLPVAGGSSGSRLMGLTDSVQPSRPSGPAGPSGSRDTSYLSAMEEKEQQRKRFEDAQKRVASGSSIVSRVAEDAGPATEEPIPYDQIFPSSSGAMSSRPEKSYLSAAEEKEQQRKRFEDAQKRVASGSSTAPRVAEDAGPVVDSTYSPMAASVSGSSQPGPSQPSSSSAPSSKPTGLNEKEQMRRFYEAQDRVAQASNRSPLASPEIPQQGFGSPSMPIFAPDTSFGHSGSAGPVSSGGLGEKEQMRRYYEAQDKVAHAGGHGSPGPTPVSRLVASPALIDASGTDCVAPTKFRQSESSGEINEKEQMRRYYEAQDKVARVPQASGSGSGSGSNLPPPVSAPATMPRNGQTAIPLAASRQPPSAPSAINEKEQMRRFYEAQDRVARAANGEQAEAVVPAYDGSTSSGLSGSSDLPGPSRSSDAMTGSDRLAYPSAEQEKEDMRKRFEAAQIAVERRKQAPATPSMEIGPSAWDQQPSSSRSRDASGSGNLGGTSSMGGTSSTSGHKTSNGSNGYGFHSASGPSFTAPSGPPPPLPVKPPKEYIDLLSPVRESGPSFARFGGMGGGSGPGQGPGSGSGGL